MEEGIWKVSRLPHSRRQKESMQRSEKEICVLCEEITKDFEHDIKANKWIQSKPRQFFSFFFPQKELIDWVYSEVGKWGCSINNWVIFVQARMTHSSLSNSPLPWGGNNVIFQRLSAFHIIFSVGLLKRLLFLLVTQLCSFKCLT